MRRAIPFLVVLAAPIIAPERAAAGPWTPEQGHGYAKIWFKWLPGWSYLDGEGESFSIGAYHELFLAAYGEVGVLDWLAITVHSDLVRLFVLEDPRTDEDEWRLAPGDPAIGVRARFLELDRFVTAAEVYVRAPLATGDPVQPVIADEPTNPQIGALQIGQGAWDFGASVSAGYAWDHFYLAGSVGYVIRTDAYDHVITWTAEGGGTVDRFGIRVRLTGHHPVDTGSAPRHSSPSGIGNGTQYAGFAVESDYRIGERWFVGLTLEGGLFLIERQAGGPVISVYGAAKF
jgi:hypothetical protein